MGVWGPPENETRPHPVVNSIQAGTLPTKPYMQYMIHSSIWLYSQNDGAGRKKASKSRSADACRIHQLEHQVRDLNDIIKKRFPNSLSALIMAAKSSDGGENPAGMWNN